MIDSLKKKLRNGSERSIKAKKNIVFMLFTKGGSILIGLLLVPLTLDYVNSETYGVWMTISSVVAWIHFFDIGIGNGLKNRLAECLAHGDLVLGRKYVSTTYAFLSMIFIPLMVILLIAIPFVDWLSFLNLKQTSVDGLVVTIEITTAYFCINFILNTINTILIADQRPADSAFRIFLQQLFSLIVIFLLTRFTTGNLVNLCMALCAIPLAILVFFNITLFKRRYHNLAPSWSFVDFKVMPDLMKLGVQFFIIQIAVVVQYQMFNFLILRYFGAVDVTAYNISNKYFNILFMVWGILTTPLWVAVTDSIAKKDFVWLARTMHKYAKLLILFFTIGVMMLALSKNVFELWIGDKVKISFSLCMWILLYNLNLIVSNLATSFINGAGILKVQSVMSCITPFVFLGLSVGLIKAGMGIEAIFISAIIANVNGIVIAPIQTYMFIKKHSVSSTRN